MIPFTPPPHTKHRYVERDLLHSLLILAVNYIYHSNESILKKMEVGIINISLVKGNI